MSILNRRMEIAPSSGATEEAELLGGSGRRSLRCPQPKPTPAYTNTGKAASVTGVGRSFCFSPDLNKSSSRGLASGAATEREQCRERFNDQPSF